MSREFIVSEKDGSVKKIICSACGAIVSKTDLRCPNCGDIWVCAECGTEFGENDLKCPKCPPVQSEIIQPTESYFEERRPELFVGKRHIAIRGLMRFGNFIGWFLCFTLLFLPIGLALLYLGHITLASIETEQNTREMVSLFRENLKTKKI